YEVFKVILRESKEDEALHAVAAMQKGNVVDLSTSIAMNASKISIQYSLPMADSIILSTARAYECIVWTQDSDFKNIPDVKFFPKAANYVNPADS
ncbi:MAG: type II toxin-antitoxin system VapC family toxin, partial [Desulfobacterales bacterium]|nr:type II toxin-antitoxin system VapC family toxin [Desulfobacterales bacterium]